MSKLTVWLIRHGESSSNAGTWSADPTQVTLTERGEQQAQQAMTQITQQPNLIVTSPLLRAQKTAGYILEKWPQAPHCVWPIQELIYLSPSKLLHLDPLEKKQRIQEYWQLANPAYCDGDDAESFADFLQRIAQFHLQLLKLKGFVVVVGHGQFFKAYQLGLDQGFTASTQGMQFFRHQETTNPIKNGEIIKLAFP